VKVIISDKRLFNLKLVISQSIIFLVFEGLSRGVIPPIRLLQEEIKQAMLSTRRNEKFRSKIFCTYVGNSAKDFFS